MLADAPYTYGKEEMQQVLVYLFPDPKQNRKHLMLVRSLVV